MARKIKKAQENPEELSRQHKGRLPGGIKDQIIEYNKQKKLAVKQKKDGSIIETPKMDLFIEEFLKNGGNATEAASKVFDCKTRASAASIGHVYLKEARLLGRIYMEEKGFTYGKILELIAGKAVESKDPDFLDRLLKILGYHDFMTKQAPQQTVNIIQTEKDILSQYIEGEPIRADAEPEK